MLPYRVQDRYDRVKKPVDHKVAVLENDRLRATFMLDLGGRLWSLYDKAAHRELLMANPVFQPANLAIRNAWISGGVEWNVSLIGHSPFTCSPAFAVEVESAHGPVLRVYEFERARGIVFSIDFSLPDGSDFLFSSPTIVNPNGHDVDMYWWSNIAVPETEGMRVLAPTDEALGRAYDTGEHGLLDLREHPDRACPTKGRNASDMYFKIPEGRRPWVAGVNADGSGLLHVSSPRLFGRKMFIWGMNPGGRKWQEFLSVPGAAYIEIQAGLATTQSEYVKMPARACWTWTEAFGPLRVDASVATGPDWTKAWQAVDAEAMRLVPEAALNACRAPRDASMKQMHVGSGWGALEELRRGAPLAEGVRFPVVSMGAAERNWRHLLMTGAMEELPATEDPGEFMVQPEWTALLEESIAAGPGNHWLSLYHLGVALWGSGDREGAEAAWRSSVERTESAWAYRNLAVAAELRGAADVATEMIVRAVQLLPTEAALVNQACAALLAAKRYTELRKLAASLPEAARELPRVRLALASASLALGDLDAVDSFFERPLDVVDIREGEVSLSEMWFDLEAAKVARAEELPLDEALKQRVRKERKPPKAIDFRMSE
jgi:hypothetical protein